MFSNPIVNVALGLVLMYLMLSLFCTVVNEFIATLTNLRSRYLKSAINWLLEDKTLMAKFHANGLVQAIQPRPGMLRKLLQTRFKGGATSGAAQGGAAMGSGTAANWQASYVDGKTFAAALFSTFESMKQSLELADLKEAAETRKNMGKVLGDVLRAEIDAAGTDIEKVKVGLAHWFDKSMDQISGVYKRRMKWISLGVGIVIAFALNANSITVAQQLWESPQLQQKLVTLAQATAANGPAGAGATGVTPGARVSGSDASSTPANRTGAAGGAPDLGQSLNSAAQSYSTLTSAFPMIGLGAVHWKSMRTRTDWLVYFFGLLFTGVALSFGAPFWFDLLSRIVNMRNDNDPTSDKGEKKDGKQPTG